MGSHDDSDARQMRAALFAGERRIDVVERPMPDLGPSDVLVEVELCALCGSDKRLLESGASVTPGHEIAGRVIFVGEKVERVKIGERILVYIPLYCGSCPACRKGRTNRCANLTQLVGWQVPGGFQEYLAVPEGNVLSVPDDLALSRAVLALDTVGTSAHGLRESFRFLEGIPETIAVIGCGPLGIGVSTVAEVMGATHVVVDDVLPARLSAAKALGFERIDAEQGKIPLVVEASGSSEGRDRAMALVEPGGVVLLLGEGSQPWVVPASPAWRRLEAAYIRSFYFPLSEVADNWEVIRRCGSRLASLIDDVRPLDSLFDVFIDFVSGKSVKPLVTVKLSEHIQKGVFT